MVLERLSFSSLWLAPQVAQALRERMAALPKGVREIEPEAYCCDGGELLIRIDSAPCGTAPNSGHADQALCLVVSPEGWGIAPDRLAD